MHYCCEISDRKLITNPQNHRVCGKLVQRHMINNPKFSEKNRIFHDHFFDYKKNMNFKLMRLFLKMNLKL